MTNFCNKISQSGRSGYTGSCIRKMGKCSDTETLNEENNHPPHPKKIRWQNDENAHIN